MITSKTVVINADDFGLSPGVNQGVLKACGGGIVTSVSLLMNAPGTEDALGLAQQYPELDVGVHLNLTDGRPVGKSEYRRLVGPDGAFVSPWTLAARLLMHRDAVQEARSECGAQIARCVQAGIRPSHLDSHKYIQVLPGLCDAFPELASEHGIRHVRNLREMSVATVRRMARLGLFTRMRPGQILKSLIVSLMAGLLQRKARHAAPGSTEHFLGISLMDFSSRRHAGKQYIQDCLRLAGPGTTEIMCHPGLPDEGLDRLTPYTRQRKTEFEALTDPDTRKLAGSLGVKLVSWRDL